MKSIKKFTAGVMAIAVITGLTGCGTSEQDLSGSIEATVASTTTEGTSEVNESINAKSEEVKPSDEEETTEKATESSTKTDTKQQEKEESSMPSPETDSVEVLAVEEAVNNAMNAALEGDADKLLDCTDMEILYYMEYGVIASAEELKHGYVSGDLGTLSASDTSAQWELKNIAPVNEDSYTEMNDFLYNGFAEMLTGFQESGIESIVGKEDVLATVSDFNSMKEKFNIADVYAVQIVEHSETETDAEADSDTTNAADYGSETSVCYMFKIDGKWKLDLAYTTYYMMNGLASSFSE